MYVITLRVHHVLFQLPFAGITFWKLEKCVTPTNLVPDYAVSLFVLGLMQDITQFHYPLLLQLRSV